MQGIISPRMMPARVLCVRLENQCCAPSFVVVVVVVAVAVVVDGELVQHVEHV